MHKLFSLRRLTLALLAAFVVSPLLAAPPAPPAPADTEARRKVLQERFGGLIPRISGPAILYLNAQDMFTEDIINEGIEEIARITRLPRQLESADDKSGDWMKLAAKKASESPDKVAFAILLVEDKNLPALLVAPQDGWGILNVSALQGAKKAEREVLEARLKRQLWRVTTWTLGGGTSKMPSAMNPAFSAEDLDNIGLATPPDQIGPMLEFAGKRGMEPYRMVPYRKAVEDGWAPEPTDEYQRKIWDELRK